tara:strand:- start:430 stop:558 length:129 start_codon:yes stop_codon:yes gene_type:complete
LNIESKEKFHREYMEAATLKIFILGIYVWAMGILPLIFLAKH